jgi:hypothetical protein
MDAVEKVIAAVRNSREDSVAVYSFGHCYEFFKILKSIFSEAEPYYSRLEGHVYTYIFGKFYDITGRVYRLPRDLEFLNHRGGHRPHRWGNLTNYDYRGRKASIYSRIMKNIDRTSNGCYVWKGSTSGNPQTTRGHGYGRISINGKSCAVHRVMYTLVHGYIPYNMQIDHICNNRLCCNPSHLQLLSPKKNIQLMHERKRSNGSVL